MFVYINHLKTWYRIKHVRLGTKLVGIVQIIANYSELGTLKIFKKWPFVF